MTRDHIKQTAIIMVKEAGLINLSRRELCERAGIPDGSFPHIVGCNFSEFIDKLKTEVADVTVFPVSKSRVDPTLRHKHILNIAITMAKKTGYHKITRDGIAENAGVSMGLVTRYLGTMKQLRRTIMRAAIAQQIPEIIAQGIANGDTQAKKAPDDLKAKAVKLISNY